MGLFTPKNSNYYYASVSPMGSGPRPQRSRPKDTSKENLDDDEDVEVKKVYEKEKIVKAPIEDDAAETTEGKESRPETETQLNTRLNSLLYHTSNDSVDLYRLENTSLDLLGRIYYDDYDPTDSEAMQRISSLTSLSTAIPKNVTSPKIRPSFERGVSFDTLSDSHHLSIILKEKHPEFRFRRNNKTFLIGFSNDLQSMRAVEWAFQEMVINGDTIVLFQVLDDRNYKVVDRKDAEAVVEKVKKLNVHQRKISLVYEVVIGRPQKLLKQAILEYNPAMMVVGTHQEPLSTSNSSTSLSSASHHMPFFGKSSISKYFLQYALVPVIVVKPNYQYEEALPKPIDSQTYFQDWLAGIDISLSFEKKKKKNRLTLLSPLTSRNSSSINLAPSNSVELRGRSTMEKDPSFTVGSRDSSVSSQERSRSEQRNRSRSRSRLSRLFH